MLCSATFEGYSVVSSDPMKFMVVVGRTFEIFASTTRCTCKVHASTEGANRGTQQQPMTLMSRAPLVAARSGCGSALGRVEVVVREALNQDVGQVVLFFRLLKDRLDRFRLLTRLHKMTRVVN